MLDDLECYDLCRLIFEKCNKLLGQLEFNPDNWLKPLERWMKVVSDFNTLMRIVTDNPDSFAECIKAYFEELATLCNTQLSHMMNQTPFPAVTDKRFQGEAWQQPVFAIMSQHHLLIQKHLTLFWDSIAGTNGPLVKRAQFFVQNFLDAVSPDNFLLTNPDILAQTIESNGKNLLRGLNNLLDDIDSRSARLMMSMTDRSAFKVGHNIAVTPGKIVYRNELIELIQYSPQTPTVKAVPLLIIPPWINKYYILDLSSDNSLVRWLVSQGITVFMISWRNPDKTYADIGLTEYVRLGPLAAIGAIQTQLQVPSVSALGFCIGGTLLTLLLAYNKANQNHSVRSATFLASMIDFSEPGDLGVFMHEEQVTMLEKHMQQQGYLEGEWMASAFNALRAKELIWAFFIKHYLQGQAPVAFDLLYWNSDSTNMPFKMQSEYMRWMYLNNDLVKPDKIKIHETLIDVRRIDLPAFFVSTQKDHIAPWRSTYQGFQLLTGKKRFLLGGSGHIAGIVIPPGKDKYGYYTSRTYPKDPEQWLAGACYSPGSWWPEWLQWLKQHSGRVVKAKLPLQPLADAPGSYVQA
jgi:polyhydroxyalkanoate synthase